MKFFSRNSLFTWLSQLNPQVWILAVGRFLSEVGTGFTLFYAPLFFVNSVGFSATAVGWALGSASISGVLGRILGGSLSDSRFWGRRRTLLLSAVIAAIASFVLATTNWLGYWALAVLAVATVSYNPSASALITDLAPPSQLGVYFSVNSLCWAAGYFIGPPLGGWALDRAPQVADSFWFGLALSVSVTIAILQYLHRMLVSLD